MRVEREGRGRATWLSKEDYERLLAAAETYRESIVCRLGGDVGLRPAEMTRIRPNDVERVRSNPPRFVLSVPDGDGGTDREAYLPPAVERELTRYARSNGVADDEPILDVTPRRVQMLVREVADRAADRTGREGFRHVSSPDLRRFFARRLLVERGVNPRVVKAVGGWGSYEGLEPYLDPPTRETVVKAFESTARPVEGGLDWRTVGSLLEGSDRWVALELDANGYVERCWNGEDVLGVPDGSLIDVHFSTLYPESAVRSDRPEEHLALATENGQHTVDGTWLDVDGERRWVSVSIAAIRRDGTGRGFAVLACDLTDQRRHREALERRATITAGLDAIDEAILEASTRDALETGVCEAATGADAYDAAWIVGRRSDDRLSLTAHDGIDRPSLDTLWVGNGRDVAMAAVETRRVQIDDDGSAAAIPLVTADAVYGVLGLSAGRYAFENGDRDRLTRLGRRIGERFAAIRCRKLLLSDAAVELEFRSTDENAFFAAASRRLDCTFTVESIVPVESFSFLFYARLKGARAADAFDLAAESEGVDSYRLVEQRDDGALLAFVLSAGSLALTISDYGGTVRELEAAGGEMRVVAECAPDVDVRTVVEGVRARFPRSELVGKQDVERETRSTPGFRRGAVERLTERQEAALRAAYFGGYFDWPRGSTAEEIADSMGISSPTLHHHLRKGQHELLRTVFEPDAGP